MTVTAQRLWLWVFSLAFLSLSGFNGYSLIDLEGSPWAGDSSTIRALRAQLDRLNTSQETMPPIEWREPYESDALDAGPSANEDSRTILDASPIPDAGAVVPPVLTGIVSVLSSEGQMVFRALLDGHMKDAGQRVGGFLITHITERGVHLRHPSGHVFLPNHDPIFSIDRGNARSTQ